MEDNDAAAIAIREYDPTRDLEQAEAVERMCEVGPSGEMSLFTDLLGDPLCRVRHSPAFLMLVRSLTSYYYYYCFEFYFKEWKLKKKNLIYSGCGNDVWAGETDRGPHPRLHQDRYLRLQKLSPLR